mmetsp:Transcript_41032/g.67911  ORF Transcript_41032/g.67911 Transcript_41032/m.67911 type:complete len:209 (-) Transcript_41032:861-1487(-)
MMDAVRSLPCRTCVDHLCLQGFPPIGTRIEHVNRSKPCPRSSSKHPQFSTIDSGHGGRTTVWQRLHLHPTLQTAVISLDRIDDPSAIETSNGIDAALQLAAGAISPRKAHGRAHLPRVTKTVIDLHITKRLVVQILSPEHVQAVSQRGCAEVGAFCGHGPAGSPTLISHIQHLHGAQMFVPIMASHCKDQREGEEVHTIESCFLYQSF